MGLQSRELGGAVVAKFTAKGSLGAVDHHVAVPVELVLELALANLTVVEKLPLALSCLKAILVVDFLHFPVRHVVSLTYVFQEVFDVGVLLFAETAMPFNLLVHPLNVHLQVTLTQAAEGAVLTAELLTGVLAHVDTQIGFDGTGVVTLRALEWLLVGVNSKVGLQRVSEFEDLVAVLAGEDLELSLAHSGEVKLENNKKKINKPSHLLMEIINNSVHIQYKGHCRYLVSWEPFKVA